jgi:hypothetical protein
VHPELLGCWVRSYEYDGLGRLVTVLSPQQVEAGNTAPVRRVEQYLHDGEQRIAEVVAESAGHWAASTQCEYIWDPHAVDRLVCQLDSARLPWVVLSNRVGTPTALVDGQTGQVAEQYAIGPFGDCTGLEVLSSTQAAAGQVLKIGYQGLFMDRLDAILGKPVLMPGARTLVHNRARVYMPRLGRFLQQDPNMAGIALPGAGAAALPGYGMPPAALAVDVDPLRQYGDGTNLYAAVGGNPMGQRDPRGLFGLISGLGAGYEMADMAADMMDQAYSGVVMGLALYSSIRSYAGFQDVNAEWATDWSISDEGSSYSQSFDLGIGVWADDEAADLEEGGAGPAMAGIRLGPNQDRATYEARRSQWSSVRQALWKLEAKQRTMRDWGDADIKRMMDGRAPKGWSLHHRRPLAYGGTNNIGNLYLVPTSVHQANFSKMHKPPFWLPPDAIPLKRR